jgi:hypothetical protein
MFGIVGTGLLCRRRDPERLHQYARINSRLQSVSRLGERLGRRTTGQNGLTDESQSDFSKNPIPALQGLRGADQAIENLQRSRRTARDGQERDYFFSAALDFQAEPATLQFDERSDDRLVTQDHASVAEGQTLAERRRLAESELRAPDRSRELRSGNTRPHQAMSELHFVFAYGRPQRQGSQRSSDLVVVASDQPSSFVDNFGATVWVQPARIASIGQQRRHLPHVEAINLPASVFRISTSQRYGGAQDDFVVCEP